MNTTKTNLIDKPLISIVIPALNEALTIGEFVDWCFEGLKKAGVSGQVIIIDSSTDNTAEIAREHGAEVVQVPKRGLGRAYIDAIPFIRSKYIIMGDADLTYDFREIKPFIDMFDKGFEFIMGSRFLGYIEPGSMPFIHRYFGTPLTTWILNLMYRSHYSDIHCGMRGITLEALKKINLQSQSWEYASEMVLKAACFKLNTTEVPINFYKDREGRLSHHKRSGWTSSWKAGWINLRAMFLYGADFFLNIPGWVMFIFGLVLSVRLSFGEFSIGPIFLNLHWMLLSVTLATLGYNAIMLGVISRLINNFDSNFILLIKKYLTYDRGMFFSAFLFTSGFLLNLNLVGIWFQSGLRLINFYYPGILGLLLMILGFQTFTFVLIIQMIIRKK